MSGQIVCRRCVIDRSAQETVFDTDGICNFCHQARKALKEVELEKPNFPRVLEAMKKSGKGKQYDVLCGLSGGADSSTALRYAVEYGLRPLAFSLDNGFNRGRESDENILKLVEALQVPFFRYVVDFRKFRELYSAFIRGGVMNLEAITDHLLFAATYEVAAKYGIKYIVSGGNTATESIMPASWGEDPRDLRWIKGVYREMTGKELRGLPLLPLWKEQWYRLVHRITFVRILDYLDYNRENALAVLREKYGYKEYGEKHCESVLTWWYQNFYLFEKYGIDKRKAHYSSCINSGQMTRREALEKLSSAPEYPKLGFEEKALRYPKRSYGDYPNSALTRSAVVKCYGIVRRLRSFCAAGTR